MRLLGFLRDGSPIAVLDRLGYAIKATRSEDSARKALVAELTAADPVLHAGACQVKNARPLAPGGLERFFTEATGRGERLGLLASRLGQEILGLPALADSFGTARVVELYCHRAGRPLFFVLGQKGGSFRVVSVQQARPGIEPPQRPEGFLRISRPADVVSPFIPAAEEAL